MGPSFTKKWQEKKDGARAVEGQKTVWKATPKYSWDTTSLADFPLLEVKLPKRKGLGGAGGKERWLMHSRMISHRIWGQREISDQNFCSRILSSQVCGEVLDHIFSCQIVRWGLPCGSPIRAPAVFGAYSVLWKMHAHCYYMEISCSIFLSTKCFVHWISSLTGREAISVVAGCYSLLLQRNNTIQSFTCMTISLVSKEIQEISNELTLL